MKIDWNELSKGIGEELEKAGFIDTAVSTAAAYPGLAGNLAGKAVSGVGNMVGNAVSGVGNMVNKAVTSVGKAIVPQGIQDTWNGLQQLPGQIAKAAPLAISAMGALSGGGQRGQNQQPAININLGGPKKNILNSLEGGEVGSLGSPKIGSANMIGDAVSKAVQSRMVNSVIDKVIAKKPEQPAVESKELELVSKYPEMAKLLEDEHNKAYLERLMKG